MDAAVRGGDHDGVRLRLRRARADLARALERSGGDVRIPGTSCSCFPQSRIAVTVRTALDREPCDERLYPKDAWNACIYAGRRQEELLQHDTWKELVSPWKTNEGPSGWEDNFSVEARTTACFAAGKYVFHTRVPARRLALFIDGKLVVDPEPATPRNVFDSGPFALSGCHELRVTYSARDRDTSFEARWAKVGSALERSWANGALACDPACASDARCVPAAPFGITRTNARICLPTGRRGSMGEACSASAPCGGPEIFCCRPDGRCGGLPCICTYLDR